MYTLLDNTRSDHVYQLNAGIVATIERRPCGTAAEIVISVPYRSVYGMGEKFDGLNQKGKTVENTVIEKFCMQGNFTYLSVPFFVTESGIGLYVATQETTRFDFGEKIICRVPSGAGVFILTGTIREMFSDYLQLTGKMKLPPRWAFGPWISANHWNREEDVDRQVKLLKEYQFPASVIVLEAWSDEATFYVFNGAEHRTFQKDAEVHYEDFDFSHSKYWHDPKAMIQRLHEAGMHLVLWQIPVYKKMSKAEDQSEQNAADRQYAARQNLCIANKDGTPYEIPQGHWFEGSYIPDFTNGKAKNSWFGKRRYLLDIGVDGFKTDGGEFIYSDNISAADGSDGRTMKNRYCQDYLNAYTEFIGENRVLFSRAGFTGAQKTPIHWAGDHQSTNEEFASVLSAGLSASMSGITFWGFDIGGFAGPLPTADLYLRATMMACFCPIMQWHSEPDGGQFSMLMPGAEGNNERSPWNIGKVYGDRALVDELRYFHWLRMNLQEYLYNSALCCVKQDKPMMRPLVFDWEDDPMAVENEDEYMLGESLLVAPLMKENSRSRDVYLPQGKWYGFFSHKSYQGNALVNSKEERFPVFIKDGTGVVLVMNHLVPTGSPMDSQRMEYHFILAGESGRCSYNISGDQMEYVWNDSGVVSNVEQNNWEIVT
ncbi:MAG: glycosyl hydrolase [Lachnospiraceae bacterium]|jgi:alpha-D-xyloside xylohydrolase|nr:glycosyl hydrolase [Lachnospiraceae bacterium]